MFWLLIIDWLVVTSIFFLGHGWATSGCFWFLEASLYRQRTGETCETKVIRLGSGLEFIGCFGFEGRAFGWALIRLDWELGRSVLFLHGRGGLLLPLRNCDGGVGNIGQDGGSGATVCI